MGGDGRAAIVRYQAEIQRLEKVTLAFKIIRQAIIVCMPQEKIEYKKRYIVHVLLFRHIRTVERILLGMHVCLVYLQKI